MALWHRCKPVLVRQEGGEHTGIDVFLRCACGKRTQTHIECERVTDEVRRAIRKEWRRGNLTPAQGPQP